MPECPAQRMKSTDEDEKMIKEGQKAEEGQYSHDLHPPGQSRRNILHLRNSCIGFRGVRMGVTMDTISH